MKIACIVLNRNLKEVTDKLCRHLLKYDVNSSDLYVVEAGSDNDKLSEYCSWHAKWEDACDKGLRYPRGMNFALLQLWLNGEFYKYDGFFLLTNDTELDETDTVSRLSSVLEKHPKLGILSPCGKSWGEAALLKDERTKYFWYIHNNAYLLRRDFLECILNQYNPSHYNFVFDGSNFRGYGLEDELIAKAYINDWAAGITSEVFCDENESYLRNFSELIKTDIESENLKKYVLEGLVWMRKKYGFNSHWALQEFVKQRYEDFFKFNPDLITYRI